MGFMNFVEQRIDGITSLPGDLRSQGPRAALANRADSLWSQTVSAVKTVGKDVGARR